VRARGLLGRLREPGALSVELETIFELKGDLGARPFASRCLVRGPVGTPIEDTARLFAFVRAKHAELPMDRAFLAASLRAAHRLPETTPVAVTLHGTTVARDRELLVFLSDAAAVNGVEPSRLVVEIVGQPPSWHDASFRNNIEGLKAIGVKIAVDIGARCSGYHAVVDCRPDYLMLDRGLVSGLHADFFRRAVVASLAHLAETLGSRLIAEGVESPLDLRELRRAGVRFVQGQLPGLPAPASVR
jgi:EAL domain-containing protein (putative c-di-GMP-specific phosphodiesterase class I)